MVGLLCSEVEIGTNFHVFIGQIFRVSTVCLAQARNREQGGMVLALPSGAEMGPPSTVEAEQLLGQPRAGEVREGFLEEALLKPSPQEKQELAGEKP